MTEDEIYIAIEKVIVEYSTIKEKNILRSYPGQRVPLPKTNNYAIMTFTGSNRTSTPNYEEERVEDEEVQAVYHNTIIKQPTQGQVQIDFFGKKAKENADAIIALSRSYILCDFLAPYNIQPLYCDEARNGTFVSEEKDYVPRWSVVLDIAYQNNVRVKVSTFAGAELNIFETEL